VPDIAGKDLANPIGQIWCGAMMLDHLGHAEASAAIVSAIETVLNCGPVLAPLLPISAALPRPLSWVRQSLRQSQSGADAKRCSKPSAYYLAERRFMGVLYAVVLTPIVSPR
jgi:hypothetical protein